jgi:hydroxypyruvate isomerase
MERRNFLKKNIFSGAALAVGSVPFIGGASATTVMHDVLDSKPFTADYAVHDGMFASHAGPNFIEQIRFAHSVGFRSIEDNGMMSRTPAMQQKIGDTLSNLGMRMGVFVIAYDNWPLQISLTSGDKQWREKFIAYCKDAVEVAKRCGAKWMTVVPGNFDRKLPLGIQTARVIESLRYGTEILEKHNLIMVLEPLSDTPDLFLRHTDQTYAICKAVNSPSCKILFDMYHMQRNEGNVIANINLCWDEIAYFQIGDNPGRNEPGTGEMNYQNLFKHIYGKGYRGVYGMEHGKAGAGKEGETALINAYRLADNFTVGN